MYKEVFKRFMDLVKPLMKAQGYKVRNNNFYKRHPQGNIGIINLQKNWRGFPKFTINVGIYSLPLAEFFLEQFGETRIKENPSISDSHWQTDIGSLVPREYPAWQKDEFWKKFSGKWWWYDEETDINQLFKEVSELILNYAIPAIDSHLSDQQLLDLWVAQAEKTKESLKFEKNSEHYAATERGRVQILRDLSVLFLAYGEKEKFHLMMVEFGEYLSRYPQYKGLKEDYDKLLTEPAFTTIKPLPKSLQDKSSKIRTFVEEVSSSTDHSSKKMKP